MDPFTMMMIAQGVQSGAKYGSRLLQPKFGATKYGSRLKRQGEQGNLTPGQEANILGKTARTAGRQSALSTSRYAGELINRGQFGSVSAQRGLREAEADVRRTVADTTKDIYGSEESAKTSAKDAYAQAVDQDKAERRDAVTGLVTVGADFAGNMARKKYAEQQASKTLTDAEQQASKTLTDTSYRDATAKYGENIQQHKDLSGNTFYTGAKDAKSIDTLENLFSYEEKLKFDKQYGPEKSERVDGFLKAYETDKNYTQLYSRLIAVGFAPADIVNILTQLNQ